jgi:hypothetical protein
MRITIILLSTICFVGIGCVRYPLKTATLTAATANQGVVYYLPKKFLKLTIQKKNNKDEMLIEALPAVPDQGRAYVVSFNHASSWSDTYKISTTANGLLEGVENTAEDKSGEVVVKLVDTAIQAAKIVVRFTAGDAVAARPEFFEYIFEPQDTTSVNAALTAQGFPYQVTLSLPPNNVSAGPDDANPASGIVYRRSVVATLTVANGANIVKVEPLVLPIGPIVTVPIAAGRFAKNVNTLKFEDGMLIEASAERPSEVLGFVSILPDTLSKIASIPAELVQVKLNISSEKKSLLEAQKALIEAQQALLDAQNPSPDPM